jgi:hypothetical protein
MPALPPQAWDRPVSETSLFRRCLPEHDPEKWMPVFRIDHARTKKPDHDPIQFDRIMV